MAQLSPNGNPNFVQGCAIAALTWVVYDVCLTFDRELSSVWRSSWSISKILFIFSRYHTIFALGFFLMEAIGTKRFTLRIGTGGPLPTNPGFWARKPPSASHAFNAAAASLTSFSYASRWYLGLTQVLSIMSGELMILIRINAVYGWSRHVVVLTLFLFFAESVIGFTTTIVSIQGGTKGLFNSTNILSCNARQAYIPDVNISSEPHAPLRFIFVGSFWLPQMHSVVHLHGGPWCATLYPSSRMIEDIFFIGIYLILVVHKAKDLAHIIDDADGQLSMKKVGNLFGSQTTHMTPTLHVCLRDAAIYFGVVFCVLLVNLVLVLVRDRYAYIGTAWLLATYSVASTRIFLNLKDISAGARYNESSWSKFQDNSALESTEMQSVPRTVDAEQPLIHQKLMCEQGSGCDRCSKGMEDRLPNIS
ncbi:hypothetical protein B0H13DRAFT_2392579 [Mycena leptocephala]|nr:hypothetical protein B0H13DRAFT_2392579 [Mycena leptocephala]